MFLSLLPIRAVLARQSIAPVVAARHLSTRRLSPQKEVDSNGAGAARQTEIGSNPAHWPQRRGTLRSIQSSAHFTPPPAPSGLSLVEMESPATPHIVRVSA